MAASVTSDPGVTIAPVEPPAPDDGGGGYGTWAIVGIVALSLLVVIILAAIIHFCFDQYKNRN